MKTDFMEVSQRLLFLMMRTDLMIYAEKKPSRQPEFRCYKHSGGRACDKSFTTNFVDLNNGHDIYHLSSSDPKVKNFCQAGY